MQANRKTSTDELELSWMREWLDGMSVGEVAVELVLGAGLWMGTSLTTFALLVSL